MDEQDVAFCPHCGNTAPQQLQGQTISLHHKDGAHNYFLTQCGTCLEALLYCHIDPRNTVPQISYGSFELARYELVWPEPGTLHQSVPESVRKIYEEAAAIKAVHPTRSRIKSGGHWRRFPTIVVPIIVRSPKTLGNWHLAVKSHPH